MEIISIYCFITFILGAVFMLTIHCIVNIGKVKKTKNNVQKQTNNVHFYMARDKDGELWLYMGKPIRSGTAFRGNLDKGVSGLTHLNFRCFGLNKDNYTHLKWEDEPVEVFINMED